MSNNSLTYSGSSVKGNPEIDHYEQRMNDAMAEADELTIKVRDQADTIEALQARIAELEATVKDIFEHARDGQGEADLMLICEQALTSDGSKAAAVLEAAHQFYSANSHPKWAKAVDALVEAVGAWKGQE